MPVYRSSRHRALHKEVRLIQMPCILLVYWEGADWSRLARLMQEGRLPRLSKLVNEGVSGRLSSPPPLDPWCLASSLATGQSAARHGVVSHWERGTKQDRIRPIASTNLQAAPLWRILQSAGKQAITINWPLCYPAACDHGVIVAEPFFQTRRHNGRLRPVPPDSVRPASLVEELESLRIHADMLHPGELGQLLEEFPDADFAGDRRLAGWATQLAALRSTAAVARHLAGSRRADLLSVRFPGLEMLTRMLAAAPEPYPALLDGIHDQFDRALGTLLDTLGAGDTALLVSGHCPLVAVKGEDGRARRHSQPRGFLVAAGPDTRQDAGMLGGGLLDIAPTVLRLCDLQPGADMPGRPLAEAFGFAPKRTGIRTWNSCMTLPGREPDLEVLHGLAAEADRPPPASIEALETDHVVARAIALASSGDREAALAELQKFRRSGDPELLRVHASLLLDLRRGLDGEVAELIRAMMRAGGSRFDHSLLSARLASRQGQAEVAIEQLFDCLACEPEHAMIHVYIGREYLALGQGTRARHAFENALRIRDDLLPAHLGLAETLLAEEQPDAALDSALQAVKCGFNSAGAHRMLGRVLEKLGHQEEAAEAYRASVHIQPRLLDSHLALARLFEPGRLDCSSRHEQHRRIALQLLAQQAMADGDRDRE